MDVVLKFGVPLISFGIFLLAAQLLCHLKVFSFLKDRTARYEGIDGLRGFLAISVFFHHFIITWYWKNYGKWERPPEDYYQNYGKVGVSIFFMITGFLFLSKILNDKGRTNWLKLFESRVFRIIPLYVFVVAVVTFIVFRSTNNELLVSVSQLVNQYIDWGLFRGGNINSFGYTKIIIAGVDWTLKYEWLFYLSLPLISFVIFKLWRMFSFLLLALVVMLYFLQVEMLSFNTQLFILFMVGGIASYIEQNISIPDYIIKNKFCSLASLVAIVFSLFFPDTSLFFPNPLGILQVLSMSIFFILVTLGNDMFGLFSLKSSKFLGEISYSIYLLHGIVLYLSFSYFSCVNIQNISIIGYLKYMPILGLAVIILSSLTYLFIEKPGIDFGRRYVLSSFFQLILTYAKKPFDRIH